MVAFQDCVICWSLPKRNVAVHVDVAVAVRFVTITSPWNPPDHWLIRLYVAVHALQLAEVGLFWKPTSFGCTPSVVSVSALKPVH